MFEPNFPVDAVTFSYTVGGPHPRLGYAQRCTPESGLPAHLS
jgi:hypothetical protein